MCSKCSGITEGPAVICNVLSVATQRVNLKVTFYRNISQPKQNIACLAQMVSVAFLCTQPPSQRASLCPNDPICYCLHTYIIPNLPSQRAKLVEHSGSGVELRTQNRFKSCAAMLKPWEVFSLYIAPVHSSV